MTEIVDPSPPGTPVDVVPVAPTPSPGVLQELVHSYVYLRRCIGIIALALPFVLIIGHDVAIGRVEWRGSMSSYYYTDMRNIFVGSLCAIGVFLLAYRFTVLDDVLSNLAGVLAIGVALCPTTNATPSPTGEILGILHFSFAAGLFVLLAGFCFVTFPRSDAPADATSPQGQPSRRKVIRNRIYRTCGVVILVAVVLAGVANTSLVSPSFYAHANPLLWCETVAILAFGTSWLVKGHTFVSD